MIYGMLALAMLAASVLVAYSDVYHADAYGRTAKLIDIDTGQVIDLEEFSALDGSIKIELTANGFLLKSNEDSCALIRARRVGGMPKLPCVLEDGDLIYSGTKVYQFDVEVGKNDED